LQASFATALEATPFFSFLFKVVFTLHQIPKQAVAYIHLKRLHSLLCPATINDTVRSLRFYNFLFISLKATSRLDGMPE
jgi:hypothetical protein